MHGACGVIDTACTIYVRFVRPWLPYKGISIKNVYICMYANCLTPSLQKYFNLKGLPSKKLSFMHGFSSENRSYLREFEAEFKNALARESGTQRALFDEKNRRSKIS
jgi:hypothetical protein